MKAYIIDNSGYLIGERECQPSPLEPGKFLIPGGCITIPPIETGENEIAKWDGSNWIIAPDFSGKVYYSKTDRSEKRFQVGEDFNDGYTAIKPLDEQFQKFDNGKWVVDNDTRILHEKEIKRNERNNILNSLLWKVDRHNQEEKIGVETSISYSQYIKLLEYIQYLRDFPNPDIEWWNEKILTFEEWNI